MMLVSEAQEQETHCIDGLFWNDCTAVIGPLYSLMVIDDCQLPAMRPRAFLDHSDHSYDPAGPGSHLVPPPSNERK